MFNPKACPISTRTLVLVSSTMVMAVGLLSTPALASVYTLKPDGTGDFPNIQTAIDAAASNDVIQLINGTYTGDGFYNLDLKGKQLTFRSVSDDPLGCILDLGGQAGFNVGTGEFATIRGLALSNAGQAAVRLTDTGQLDLSHCRFWNNSHPNGQGGALALLSTSQSVTVTDCVFIGNSSQEGGALYAASECAVIACLFQNNWAAGSGGGIFGTGSLTAERCQFVGNMATAPGGALYCGAPAMIDSCQFLYNSCSALNHGTAGIHGADGVPVVIMN